MEDAGELPGQAVPWVGAPWPPFALAPAQPHAAVALKQPQKVSPLQLPAVARPRLRTCRTVPLGMSVHAPQCLGTLSWASWGLWCCGVGLAGLGPVCGLSGQCATAALLRDGHEVAMSLSPETGHGRMWGGIAPSPQAGELAEVATNPWPPMSLEQQHCESP